MTNDKEFSEEKSGQSIFKEYLLATYVPRFRQFVEREAERCTEPVQRLELQKQLEHLVVAIVPKNIPKKGYRYDMSYETVVEAWEDYREQTRTAMSNLAKITGVSFKAYSRLIHEGLYDITSRRQQVAFDQSVRNLRESFVSATNIQGGELEHFVSLPVAKRK